MIWFLQIAQLSTTISASKNQHYITLHYSKDSIIKNPKKKKKNLDIHIKRTNCNKIMQKEGEKARVRVWERRGTPGPESDCVPLLDLETLVLL